jgi:hypothetical protein
MQLFESHYTVAPDGSLILPADDLAEMGLMPHSPVTIAYLSIGRRKNTFSEFLVSGLSTSSDEQKITIPNELLSSTGIAHDADIEIACANGAIIIYDFS